MFTFIWFLWFDNIHIMSELIELNHNRKYLALRIKSKLVYSFSTGLLKYNS